MTRPTLADIRGRDRARVRGVTFGEHVDGPDRAALIEALDAVLALHVRRPWNISDGMTFGQTEFPDRCDHDHVRWPCPTVRAIESVIDLGGESCG